jgi:hypothetical protein
LQQTEEFILLLLLFVFDFAFLPSELTNIVYMELEKHKVDDAVTVDRKRDYKNDIQGPEEEDIEQQSTATTNTIF